MLFPKQPSPIDSEKKVGLIPISGCDNAHRRGNVIFVHGLGGNAWSTWHPQEEFDNNFWLTWLGEDEELPDLGIWSYGYEAEPTAWKGKTMPLFDRASNLLEWLEVRRFGQYPLIFVTHSMGGLLVKELLRTAQNFRKQDILQQSKGIVFLATPHTGSHLANLIDKTPILARVTVSVRELKAHEPQLRGLNEWYRENARRLEIKTKVYYETQPVKGISVVDPDSANPGIEGVKPVAIAANHIDICKPKSKQELVYSSVKNFLEECLNIQQAQKASDGSDNPSENQFDVYVERPDIEKKCYEKIKQPGGLICIKAPEKMGKTWLMNRIFEHVTTLNYRTVSLNLLGAGTEAIQNLEQFNRWFCERVTRQLISSKQESDAQVKEFWDKARGTSSDRCSDYFEDHLLANLDTPLVLGLDNFDRIFSCDQDFVSDVCGMLRAWHESAKNTKTWKTLRLIVVYSTEDLPRLNINQSPFNVEQAVVELSEFDSQQVEMLASRSGLDWQPDQVKQLMDMVGGHPYLVHKAIDSLKSPSQTTLQELLKKAPTDDGLYHEHFRHYWLTLTADRELASVLREVVESDDPIAIAPQPLYKLQRMGLICKEGYKVKPRCQMYRLYFRERLKTLS